MKCIGFGGKGHHNNPNVRIHHGHDEEMLIWADRWKEGTELVHLEWEEKAEELLASVSKNRFFAQSVPNTSPGISAAEVLKTLQSGLANVDAIMLVASRSLYYKAIPLQRMQEMATHGLIIHPEDPAYLTCAHHSRKGAYIKWPGKEQLLKHFDAKHKANYLSLIHI